MRISETNKNMDGRTFWELGSWGELDASQQSRSAAPRDQLDLPAEGQKWQNASRINNG